MKPNPAFARLANQQSINKTIRALIKNNIEVVCVDSTEEALKLILAKIPPESEVFTISSETLRLRVIASAINDSVQYRKLAPASARI